MNIVNEQIEILNKLSQLMYDSAEDGFDEIGCVFKYDYGYKDGSSSVGTKYWNIVNGEKIYKRLSDNFTCIELIPQLHKIMKAHTGGEWTEFTLTINKDGKANTKFKYPDQETIT